MYRLPEGVRAKMSGLKWRAISTAPKDGTTILIKAKCGFITTVIWGGHVSSLGNQKNFGSLT